MNYLELLKLALPETAVVIAAFAVILVDFMALRGQPVRLRMTLVGAFAAVGCAAAIALMLVGHLHGRTADGMLVVDELTQAVKIGLLLLTIFTVLISTDSDFTEHVGEYFALILLATVGFMFLVSTENLLMLFVALELASLSLYVLAAFNKRNPCSAEAGLKYFLFGGMAAACTLFGLSLVYGLSGSLNLTDIAIGLRFKGGFDPLIIVALVMTLAGFGFKIAAVPFHLWAPDAYQGAPTPSAALIASASKLGSFLILGKLLLIGFAGLEGSAAWRNFAAGWMPMLALLAMFSMVLGNLAAIVQNNVRRLLAYSAIAHGGYALVGLLAANREGAAAVLFYMFTYGLTVIGAFGVITVVEQHAGGARLEHFNGLSRRSPVLALSLLIFLLSLAGIPPLAGFFGKFYLFTAAVKSTGRDLGLLWLVILGIGMSAVSLYYYLQVLKRVYIADPEPTAPPIPARSLPVVIIALLAAGVVLLGCQPGWLVERFLASLQASGF
jgi:NADH-quinone oxidoreductase subunit N